MAFSSKLITINAPAGTGNQSYTGVGFQPKAILFFGSGLGADAIGGVHAVSDFGIGISSSSQRAISFIGDDADKNHTKAKYHSDAACFIQTTSAAALLINAAIVTMDSDGFTLNFTATSSGARIHCLCLGGSHLTNVALETVLTPGSTGTQAYTGAGFQPDQILAFSVGHNVAPPSGSTGGTVMSIGFASSTSTQFGVGYFASDSSDNTDCARVQDNRIILIPNSNGTGLHTAGTLSSFDTNGCTINWQTITAANMRWFLLYIKGGKHTVGSVLQKTSTGTISTGNVGIIPNGVFNISSQQTALNTVEQGSYVTIGAATSTSNRATIWAGERDETGDSITDRATDNSKMIAFWTEGTPTLLATADLSSLAGPTGITYNWTTADANARYIGYWAFSESTYDEGSGGGTVGGSAAVTPTQAQGCKSAGTGASDNSNAGNVAWTTPENIVSSNDSHAVISTSDGEVTEYIKATNFGFNLNPNAEIVGISVNVEKRCSSNAVSNNYTDAAAYIVKGGTIQTAENKALAGRWATTDTVYTYGGENDLWGVTWTANDINASNFGFVLSAEDTGSQTGRVDHIEVCVVYIPVTMNETASGGGTAGGSAGVNVVYNINNPRAPLPGIDCGAIGSHPIGEPICGEPVDPDTPYQTFYGVLCSGSASTANNTFTYNEVASGGATGGGAAQINVHYNIGTSGGATSGGTAPFTCIHNFTGGGGAVCAGTATVLATYNIAGTGGATCGGTASLNAIYSVTATSGVTCGGTSRVSLGSDKIASGGAVCSGTVSFQAIFPEVATGGIAVNGAASTLFTYNIHGAGGAVCNGTALVTSLTNEAGSGGAVCGGTATAPYNVSHVASGGAICSGEAFDQVPSSYSETGSGGAVCNGSAQTNSNIYSETGAGGVVCGGTASHSVVTVFVPSGGCLTNGTGLCILILNPTCSGGAIINGTALVSMTCHQTGTGGVVCSGNGEDFVPGQGGTEFVLEFLKPSSLYIMGQRRMFKLPIKAAKQHSSSMYQDRTSPLERI